jgi:hypothetical protein
MESQRRRFAGPVAWLEELGSDSGRKAWWGRIV